MDQAQRAMQTESDEVLYEVADHIAVITLNAPERMNTISGPMLNQLTRLLKADEDRDVRCVILTGNGRAFCAGLDFRKERSGDGISAASSATSWTCATPRRPCCSAMDKPTICALNGAAAGYGMDTALGCDIRIMAEERQAGRGLHQARHRAGERRHLVPAAADRLVEGRRADLHRPHALGAPKCLEWASSRGRAGRRSDGTRRARWRSRSPPTRRWPCRRRSG